VRARAADRKDARLDRFADRKLSLAVDLLLAADRHVDESRVQVASKYSRWELEDAYGPEAVEADTIPPVGETRPVRVAWQALDLVAPGVASAAGELYLATVPIGALAAAWPDPANRRGANEERWPRDWQSANDRWDEARHAFVDAVRRDLGVIPGASAPDAVARLAGGPGSTSAHGAEATSG